ncbi:MAG: indole-3-glycerol phosphate synthase TrpC [Gammaproteobacteria bacterium]
MNILDHIVAKKRIAVNAKKASISMDALLDSIDCMLPTRSFSDSLKKRIANQGFAIIAEAKKGSPSAGIISQNYDPSHIAQNYESLGACCVSVLTEEDFFYGHDSHLSEVLEGIQIPVLRKDFIIDPWQIFESRKLGADCILLIASILSDRELEDFAALSTSIGLDFIIEVHNEEELSRVSHISDSIIGINNRDLKDFTVSLDVTVRLKELLKPSQLFISESGIRTQEDIDYLKKHDVQAFLIGESLMRDKSLLAAITNGSV